MESQDRGPSSVLSWAASQSTYPLLCAIRISSRAEKSEMAGTHMFLIAQGAPGMAIWEDACANQRLRERRIFRRRYGFMTTAQESKGLTPIFIGRWTPKILFSLKER